MTLALLALFASSDAARLEAGGFAVTPLLRQALSGDPSREVVVAIGVFEPGATTGRHTHPGDEYATVIEGTLELTAADQPPRRVAAGQAYHNARGVIHEARNVGGAVARAVSTFIVDTGRPMVERPGAGADQP